MNLITAVNDPRLRGESLITPLRSTVQWYNRAFSVRTDHSSLWEIFERALFLTGSCLAIAALPVAALGVVAKWIDLACRIDALAHKGPAIGYHLPLPLEIYSRLGDRLAAYLNTKYVAEKNDLPVYFRPFKGAEFFAFSEEETLRAPTYFKNVVHLETPEDVEALMDVDRNESVLYLLPFFPHTRVENESDACSYIKYFVDWQAFKPRVKELLRVVQPHAMINIPKNVFSIALHIRTGGNYDSPDTATMLPAKLPPMSFYLGELENLLASQHRPKDKPLFIHIFTDDVHPENVKNVVQNKLRELGVKAVLSFSPNPNLVDDVANMNRFHCLIRPDSNLSGTLAEASDHLEVEIFPTHFEVNPQWTELTINRVQTVTADGSRIDRTTHYTMPAVKRLPTFFYKWFHQYFLGV